MISKIINVIISLFKRKEIIQGKELPIEIKLNILADEKKGIDPTPIHISDVK